MLHIIVLQRVFAGIAYSIVGTAGHRHCIQLDVANAKYLKPVNAGQWPYLYCNDARSIKLCCAKRIPKQRCQNRQNLADWRCALHRATPTLLLTYAAHSHTLSSNVNSADRKYIPLRRLGR